MHPNIHASSAIRTHDPSVLSGRRRFVPRSLCDRPEIYTATLNYLCFQFYHTTMRRRVLWWKFTDVSGNELPRANQATRQTEVEFILPAYFRHIAYFACSSNLNMKAASSSEMWVNYYQNTWRHIPEGIIAVVRAWNLASLLSSFT
jgi:hypothetical protein